MAGTVWTMTAHERLNMTLNERCVWMSVYSIAFAKNEHAPYAFDVADKAVLELRAMFTPSIW